MCAFLILILKSFLFSLKLEQSQVYQLKTNWMLKYIKSLIKTFMNYGIKLKLLSTLGYIEVQEANTYFFICFNRFRLTYWQI